MFNNSLSTFFSEALAEIYISISIFFQVFAETFIQELFGDNCRNCFRIFCEENYQDNLLGIFKDVIRIFLRNSFKFHQKFFQGFTFKNSKIFLCIFWKNFKKIFEIIPTWITERTLEDISDGTAGAISKYILQE